MPAHGSASIAWYGTPRRVSSLRTGSRTRQAPTSVATATRPPVMGRPPSRWRERGSGRAPAPRRSGTGMGYRSLRDGLREGEAGRVKLLGAVAADPVARRVLPPLGILGLAPIHGELAAGVEVTPTRRRGGIGYLAH